MHFVSTGFGCALQLETLREQCLSDVWERLLLQSRGDGLSSLSEEALIGAGVLRTQSLERLRQGRDVGGRVPRTTGLTRPHADRAKHETE